jgi:hypothetical protein
VRQTWTLVSGTVSYAVGTASTVAIDRPLSPQAIENIGYIDTSVTPTTEILFGRVLTLAEYEQIPQKALTAAAPTGWYYDPTTGTTGALKPFPIPNVSTLAGCHLRTGHARGSGPERHGDRSRAAIGGSSAAI